MKLIILSLFSISLAFAQTGSNPDGKTTEQDTTKVPAPAFVNLEPQDWLGERFVILPLKKSEQRYGYNHLRSPVGGYIVPTYDEVAGKTGTVTEVNFPARGDASVTIRLDNEEKLVTAVSSTGSFPNLAREVDLDSARMRWEKDTLWFTGNELSTYDDVSDKLSSVDVPKYSPVIVDRIETGWDSNKPLRFRVHTLNDEWGYVDAHVSNTNVAQEERRNNRFDDLFYETDPRVTYKWGDDTWTAISEGRVVTGMTTEQVRFSWGDPDRSESRYLENDQSKVVSETWWYGDTELRFNEDKLTRISE